MLKLREDAAKSHPTKKLRTACDVCHQAKMKCSGGTPCAGCRDSGYGCSYSVSNRIGRPKGTKNKRTLDRMSRKRSGASDKSDSGQASPVQAQTSMASLTNRTGNNLASMDKSSVESVLAAGLDEASSFHGSGLDEASSFPGSEAFGPLSDDLASWYEFGDITTSSPFAQQPSPTAAYLNEGSHSYSSVDSAYVSPASLFADGGSFAGALEPSGLLGNMNGETNGTQDVTAPAPLSRLASSTTCNCVQDHAELLCRLKELEQRHAHAQPRLDVVLSSAQQALVPWKSVVECQVCRHDDNQEVLSLSVMSIRTVLRSLQSLCSEYYNSVVSGQNFYDRQGTPIEIPDGMQSAIGMYEITGEERMAVKDLLILRTLEKMKYTLACFKERLETLSAKKNMTAGLSSIKRTLSNHGNRDVERLHRGGPGDLDHLVKEWRDLDSTVQLLERVLRSGMDSIQTRMLLLTKDLSANIILQSRISKLREVAGLTHRHLRVAAQVRLSSRLFEIAVAQTSPQDANYSYIVPNCTRSVCILSRSILSFSLAG